MRYLLRIATPDGWTGQVPPSEEQRTIALENFQLRQEATGIESGLSVYEVTSEAEYGIAVAGIALGRPKPRPVNVLKLTHQDIEGLPVVYEPGDTPLPQANKLHRLLVAPQDQLDEMVVRMLSSGKLITIENKAKVISIVIGIDASEIAPDAACWPWLQGLRSSA